MFALLMVLATPPPATDTITVTATRTETRLADTPQSVVVLSKQDVENSAAPTLDDVLREVPGFTLFRRTGSRTANPTSQGVSLRGIGASGASRAIVLDDGVPLNDPFGGWVYWGRVPRESVGRVEVLRGGASDLYGSGALSGVVQFIRRTDPNAIALDLSGGSERTGTGSLFAALPHVRIAADWLTTRGYILVPREQRGPVDTPANARHVALDATLSGGPLFLRASRYDESRENGTPLQTNDTTINALAAGFDAGSLSLRAYGSRQHYAQTFSAIAASRASERLTVDQRVPSRAAGGSAQWSRVLGTHHALVVGGEYRDVRGTSYETSFPSQAKTANGGTQRIAGAFAEDVIAMSERLSMTAAMRYDSWRGRQSSWSPRLSMLYRATPDLALTASAYRAFRAPTLNELYRSFRVGNVLTLANAGLSPERLSAVEAGARWRWLRATLFSMSLSDAITNATLSTTPSLITRQRQNLGSARSRGAELEGEWRVASLRLSAGWLFTDTDAQGRRIPQVPRSQATLQATWRNIGVQTRWATSQFDDDLNQFRLRGYVVTDIFASHAIGHGVDVTLAAENIFNRRIEAGATPVITLGQPRAARVGLRFRR
jgi:outer membrane receptor protein involved in Fe transport